MLSSRVKCFLSIDSYFAMFAYGIANTVILNTLFELKDDLDATFEDTSYGLVISSAAHALGFVLLGRLLKYVDKRVSLIWSTFITTLCIIILPFVKSLKIFFTLMAIFGFTVAGIAIVTNSFILTLWKDNSNPVMQSVHFAFSLGMALAPIIVALAMPDKPITYQVPSTVRKFNLSSIENVLVDSFEVTKIPPLFLTFSIPAGFLLLATAVSCFIYVYEKNVHQQMELESMEDETLIGASSGKDDCQMQDKSTRVHQNKYSWILVMIAMMIGFTYQACENNSVSFVYEFIYFITESKKRSLYIATLLSSSYAAFRFVNIFTARIISTHLMILGHMSLALICNLLLLLFANTSSKSIVSLLFILMGIGYSGVFPSLYSYYGRNIDMTSQQFAAILMSAAVSCVAVPLVEAPLLRPERSMIFLHVNITSLALSLLLFTVFFCSSRKINSNARVR